MAKVVEPLPDMSAASAPFARRNSWYSAAREICPARALRANCKIRRRRRQIGRIEVLRKINFARGRVCHSSGVGKPREILISPRRRNAKAGMNQEERLAAQRRENVERLDFLAAPGGERRFVLQKKGHVRTKRRGEFVQGSAASGWPNSSFKREQRRRGVAAAAARDRRPAGFFSPDGFSRRRKFSPPAKTRWPRGGRDFANQPADFFRCTKVEPRPPPRSKLKLVAKIDRLHDGFKFVEAVGAFAEDVQQQVDLAGRFFFQAHGVFTKAKRANGKRSARQDKTIPATVSCRTP
jgi:hypothetical protein